MYMSPKQKQASFIVRSFLHFDANKLSKHNYQNMVSTKFLVTSSSSEVNGSIKQSSGSSTFHPNSNERIPKPDVCELARRSNQHENASEYTRAIQDLNLLQSNTQVIALAKYKKPEQILPLFRRQLQLSGLQVEDLNRLNIVHVSGTKGKGSTCAFTESILRNAGLKTGFYNSPHLVKVTERIQLNGAPIDELLFAKYFRKVFSKLVEATQREQVPMPSYFAFLTILAYHIFLEEQVDCAVIEVGMGGQYDPTNVIEKPLACGITTLDYDHTNVLGSTIESIAWNKAGIIKPGVPVFTIQHEQSEVMRVIKERAIQNNSPISVCKPLNREKLNLNLGIQSSAQYANAALACKLAGTMLNTKNHIHDNLEEELPAHFREGLEKCRWPGRCQIIKMNDKMSLFIDGAHTRKSMENCLEWFTASSQAIDPNAQQILMVNVIGDRDKAEVLRPLRSYSNFTHVIFSTNRINAAGDTPKSETFVNIQGPNSDRSLDNVKSNAKIWARLQSSKSSSIPEVILKPNTHDAIKAIELLAEYRKCHILATGSLHFVGAVLETMFLIANMEDGDNLTNQ